MKLNDNKFLRSDFVKLKDDNWLKKQRIAGKVAAQTLTLLENLVKEKTTCSLIELDKIAEDFITKNACIPTFKNYKGFPNSVCISVNKQLVHGIPTDYKLKENDVISFDLGATYEGVIADTAITCIYGDPKVEEYIRGIAATYASLFAGISAIKIDNRLGCIGNAIYKYASHNGFCVIEQYGGHSIDISDDGVGIPHASPFVSNRSSKDEGIRIKQGLTLAIEPMLGPIRSSTKTVVSKDGWTVYTEDIFFHAEHTIFVHNDHVEIITYRENESDSYSNKIFFKKEITNESRIS